MATFEGDLGLMEQLLGCGTNIMMWHYSTDGHLIKTNSKHLVLDIIFEHTGNKEYMIEQAGKYRAPLIMGGQMGLMWCAVYKLKDGEPNSIYVLGPVFNADISTTNIEKSASDYNVDLNWRQAYINIMQGLPVVSSILFFQYALMLHCCVTGEQLTRSALHFKKWTPKDPGEKNDPQKNRTQVWGAEQALLRMVREGDINYQKVMSRANLLSNGVRTGGKNPLLQAIVSCTSFTSLCVREAIQAGISPDTAYSVGDSYIQSMVECKTITELRSINHAMYEDFIMRVHKHRTNPKLSMQVQLCRDYIERNVTEPLSLAVLARQVGYSEYHLSRKFKQEMGVSISAYIRYARIEHSKYSLVTTNMPISKIALELQFCSSSHFSDAFQEIVGRKPQQYRVENQRTYIPD